MGGREAGRMRAKVRGAIQRRCGSWGEGLHVGALTRSPPLCGSVVPRAPSHPLDSPAEFTSLTRSLLPPQGGSLLGTLEQALGTQSEAEAR